MGDGYMDITNVTGHRFILDEGARTLTIMNPDATQQLTLDDSKGTISITDGAGDRLIFDAKQKTLSIDFQTAVNIQVLNGSLTLSAAGGVTISSPGSITLNSPSINLGGDATLALVNQNLLSSFNNHVHGIVIADTTEKPTAQATADNCLTKKIKGT